MGPQRPITWGITLANRTQSAISIVDDIKGNSGDLAAVLRKLHSFILPFFEGLKELNTQLGHAVAVIDAFEIFNELDYWANGKYKEDGACGVTARVLSTGVNTGSLLLWMDEVKLIKLGSMAQSMGSFRAFGFVGKLVPAFNKAGLPSLGKIAAAIGECRVFSFLTKVSLLSVVNAGLGMMYVFFAIDSADKFISAENKFQRISAGLAFTISALEVSLVVLTAAAVANAVALAIIGGIALAFIVTRLVWNRVYKHEIEPVPQAQLRMLTQPAAI
jgi:hypothetical protein